MSCFYLSHTYIRVGGRVTFKCVLDVVCVDEGVGVTGLVGQEEDDEQEEEIHNHLLENRLHLQLVHAQFAGFFQ